MVRYFKISKSSPVLNSPYGLYISINANGDNDIKIDDKEFVLKKEEVDNILNNLNYPLLKEIASYQTDEGLIGGSTYIITIRDENEEIIINDSLLRGEVKNNLKKVIDELVTKIQGEAMSLLKRSEIANKFYGYHVNNNVDKDTYLDMISNYLNGFRYESNSDFILAGRKKYVYEEIMNILNKTIEVDKPLYFVLGSLEEFFSNDNYLSATEMDLREKNENYIRYGCICLEEKECIDRIISAIKTNL